MTAAERSIKFRLVITALPLADSVEKTLHAMSKSLKRLATIRQCKCFYEIYWLATAILMQ
jgi:hypothetical protein